MQEQDLTHLEAVDLKSREEFTNACVVALIATMGGIVNVRILVARGFQEFLKHAKPAWSGHAFKYEDYKRAYKILKSYAEGRITIENILYRGQQN